MIYAPRSDEEVEIVRQIASAAVEYAANGRYV
jgi:hypothetical protein